MKNIIVNLIFISSFESKLFLIHANAIKDVPECNIKIGYWLDGSKSLEGYAGSAQNCLQIVKLREPSANGITWQSESKECHAVFRATKFEKSLYSTRHSCIIDSKPQLLFFWKILVMLFFDINAISISLLSILQIRIATQKEVTLVCFLSNMVEKSTPVVILVMVDTGVPIQLQVMGLTTIGTGAKSITVLKLIRNEQLN